MTTNDQSGRREGSGRLVVLSGPSGSGKTTTCRRLISACSERGLDVSGLVTVAERREEGAERWVEDLRSAQRQLLAHEMPPGSKVGPRWRFCTEGLAWGDRMLARACPTDVLVIDEVGPLELLHGAGWRRGVQLALAGSFRLAVVAVRPPLVACLLELLRPFGLRATVMAPGEDACSAALVEGIEVAL
jgi:nucleoside-triphosphatase THEP1